MKLVPHTNTRPLGRTHGIRVGSVGRGKPPRPQCYCRCRRCLRYRRCPRRRSVRGHDEGGRRGQPLRIASDAARRTPEARRGARASICSPHSFTSCLIRLSPLLLPCPNKYFSADLGVPVPVTSITLYVPPFCRKSTTIIPEQTHGRSAPPTETNSDPWAAESHRAHSAIADADDVFATAAAPAADPFEGMTQVEDEVNLFGSPAMQPAEPPRHKEEPEHPSVPPIRSLRVLFGPVSSSSLAQTNTFPWTLA